MSDETITPALTSAEWASEKARRGAREVERDGEVLRVNACGVRIASEVAQYNHALAALALHGQAFGFTPADVEALRAARDFCRARHMHGHPRLDSIADRIAALLPPAP